MKKNQRKLKKLSLNKKTVANLNTADMDQVRGGGAGAVVATIILASVFLSCACPLNGNPHNEECSGNTNCRV